MNNIFLIIIGNYAVVIIGFVLLVQLKYVEACLTLVVVTLYFSPVFVIDIIEVKLGLVIGTPVVAAASYFYFKNSSMFATFKEKRKVVTEMSPTYFKVLQVIHNIGKQMERHPLDYKDMNEESLRNQMLDKLEPSFKGSATGETFNKKGKTDILIRVENKNVLIAECKCWGGLKVYKDALTQLLGYLTFRDTETATVMFVRGKDISSALRTVERETCTHENFREFIGRVEESWFNYRFDFIGDPEIEVKVAVLLFHIPKE